jgi:hypothetical protein
MLLSKFGFGPLGGGTLRAGSRERDGSPATSLNFLKSDDTARSPSRQEGTRLTAIGAHCGATASNNQYCVSSDRLATLLFVTVRWSPEVPTLVDGRKKATHYFPPSITWIGPTFWVAVSIRSSQPASILKPAISGQNRPAPAPGRAYR